SMFRLLIQARDPKGDITSPSATVKIWCAACGRLETRRVVACCSPCQGSADVDHPLLGYRLGGSLWLSGQLQNRGLLTLTKESQQQDLAVRKFESIVMGHCLFFVDLPKDRCSVVEHILPPAQWTDRRGRNFASKGQLGSRENADGDAGVFRCREPSRP